ncbi:DUF3306 domain-containing protein [Methylobacterium sp. Leaf118]|uniref:DUF3306 domain-containing protein n=1 Tax=Methylobacterium sp. Leaf118 TaxID=2876562 RepID=UPI001E34963E|nr:DUF3306 domain-containing protein [Methylobacterium sp. Leaf118]
MSDGFLARWARRKEAVRDAERLPIEPAAVGPDLLPDTTEAPIPASGARAGEGAAEAEPGQETSEEIARHLEELPDLDALTPQSDLTPFLRAGIPSPLRNAALRRMWSLDPAIRDFVSEACEYAYDWNTPGGVPGFGPLLPSDDVQAMLGRLFRDPARTETPAAGVEPTDSPNEASPPEADPAASEPARTMAESADPAPTPEPEQLPDRSRAPAAAALVEPSPPRPRLRRHGGAMPS